jgi:hypothetical protein
MLRWVTSNVYHDEVMSATPYQYIPMHPSLVERPYLNSFSLCSAPQVYGAYVVNNGDDQKRELVGYAILQAVHSARSSSTKASCIVREFAIK